MGRAMAGKKSAQRANGNGTGNGVELIAASERNHIRDWRVYLELGSQGDLAALTVQEDPKGEGLTRATICRLESGVLAYKEYQIELLAKVMKLDAHVLVGVNPFDDADVISLYTRLSQRDRKKVEAFVRTLKPVE